MELVKKQWNILIEYYRKQKYEESKNKEYSKELFPTLLIDHKKTAICSPTTYRKLAAGEILKNDDIYVLLLEKLGFHYVEDAYVYSEVFQEDCRKIRFYLEAHEYENLYAYLESTLSKLTSEDIIEKEYHIVMSAIYDMLQRNKNGDSPHMKHIADLFTMYNEEVKQCLDVPIYNYCVMQHLDRKIPYYLSQVENTPFHRVHVLYYQIDDNVELDKVEEEMSELIKYYEDKKNYNMLLNLYTMKMKYYYWIGKDSDEVVKEIDTFIKVHQDKISKRMNNSYLYFKAKKYNREKEYVKAKGTFEELLRNDASFISNVLGYYFNCLLMLDERVIYDDRLTIYFKNKDEIIYRYFQIPIEDYQKRETYIMKQLCVGDVLKREYLAKSFLFELRKIVKETKHYVLLDKYLEKTDDFL